MSVFKTQRRYGDAVDRYIQALTMQTETYTTLRRVSLDMANHVSPHLPLFVALSSYS